MWPLLLVLACQSPAPEPASDWRAELAAWKHPDPLPDLPLLDQDGRAFSLHDHRDRWLVLGFVYTTCPDATACPMTMQRLVAIEEASEPVGDRLHLLAVSFDPARDDPAALRAYGERFGADFARLTLATGEPEVVSEALPALFNILTLPAADGTIDHTVKLAVLRPGLVLDHEIEGEVDPAAIVARVLSEDGAAPEDPHGRQ